jgi:tRNA(fMet)-specific endonuclease VapC
VTLRYLLDTNALSEPLRPQPNPHFLNHLEENQETIATTSIVWHELLYGAVRLPESKIRRAIEQYLYDVVLPTIPILAYDLHAAKWHAAERARLERIGRKPPFADGQIAAVAAANQLLLVTANASDFAHFQELEIVDWWTE